jgi:ATP-binding cassette subfamily B protein
MAETPQTFWESWWVRLQALKNVPQLVRIVWDSGPAVVSGGLASRLLVALLPVAVLGVSKRILDAIQAHFQGHPLPAAFWWFVGAEFALASFGAILGRAIGYFDSLLSDRFSRHVSILVMEHASRLDLSSYEDSAFNDKLERARVQATDRIGMIQALGQVLQQALAALSLSAAIFWF